MGVSENKGYLNLGSCIIRILLFAVPNQGLVFGNPHMLCYALGELTFVQSHVPPYGNADFACRRTVFQSCWHGRRRNSVRRRLLSR